MEGGNEATNRSGVTQFAGGEPTIIISDFCSPIGECVIPFANAHSITAFHFLPTAFLQLFLIFFLDIAEKIDRTVPIATG